MSSEFIGSRGLLGLLESNYPLGRVVRMDYTSATIATLDYYINIAGGVPRNCFLLAVPNGEEGETPREAILLRVRGITELDLSRELRAVKEQLAASDERRRLDPMTEQRMQIAGYDCKIMGTFYEEDGELTFGSDVDRILAAQSYEVLKPHGSSLSILSSYSRKGSLIAGDSKMVKLGRVRYSETEKNADMEAAFYVDVKDFIGKKSAVLGMSRTGKSNLLKVLVSQVFSYSREGKDKIGQLIFDPQGEYANDTTQDTGELDPSSLASMGNGHDVVIYRTQMKGVGYERQLLLNLLEEDNLELLWELMLIELRSGISASSNYIAGLNDVDFIRPDEKGVESGEYNRSLVHYQRKRLGLYAFMKLARFSGSVKKLNISVGKENHAEVLALHEDLILRPIKEKKTGDALISVGSVDAAYSLFTWILQQERNGNRRRVEEEAQEVLLGVDELPVENEPMIREEQVLSESWIKDLKDGSLVEFKKQFAQYEKGRSGVVAAFQRIKELHTNDSSGDLRAHIWEDIKAGKLIIVDLSVGSPATITTLSELIVESLIQHSSERFTSGLKAVKYQIVVEEAHNLFSRQGAKENAMDPWVRLSKEGAKYEIGLVYGTQEVTGVDPRILSNTSNFIITHLNSTTEVRELSKYYSFADWSDQIIASESRGFARVKTESSPFIIPVQIDKFDPLMEDGE